MVSVCMRDCIMCLRLSARSLASLPESLPTCESVHGDRETFDCDDGREFKNFM